MKAGVTPEAGTKKRFAERLEDSHVAQCVEANSTGEHQPVNACCADKMRNKMYQCVLEDHLCCRRLVETLLRIFLVLDVFHAKHRVRVSHILPRYRLTQDLFQGVAIGSVQNIALPIREVTVEKYLTVRCEMEDRLKR